MSAWRGPVELAVERPLMPGQHRPACALAHPGLGKAHEALAETGIFRLAAKGGKARDNADVAASLKAQLARHPLERIPDLGMKGQMVDHVGLAAAPRDVFIVNDDLVVHRGEEGF